MDMKQRRMQTLMRLLRLNLMDLHTDFENREEIILRDYLALERTRLANERTLLSYIRSSLYLVLGGIAFLQMQDFTEIRWIGYVALFLSIVFIILGITRFVQLHRILSKHYYHSSAPKEAAEASSADDDAGAESAGEGV